LLEIGFWCWPMEMDDSLKRAARPEEYQQIFLALSGMDMRHLMGTEYSNAVRSCLNGATEGEIAVDLNRDVVDVLASLCEEQDRTTKFAFA
jgi:hypothetical protein